MEAFNELWLNTNDNKLEYYFSEKEKKKKIALVVAGKHNSFLETRSLSSRFFQSWKSIQSKS